jgi:hypothetical protein
VIGPTSLSKRRGWDHLPAAVAERKASYTIDDYRAVVVSPLVHGPGASDLTNWRSGDGNSAVFACLQVIATAIAEPELKVYRVKAGERVELDDAPITDLFREPNPHMTLDMLLSYLSNCLHVDGNAYWRKLRAGDSDTGNVVQLWPISPTRIEPRTERGSGDFISYYRYYMRPGQFEDIAPENIVHFRMGIDDRDHRVGCSPLKRLVREVSSDGQATRYADRLLALSSGTKRRRASRQRWRPRSSNASRRPTRATTSALSLSSALAPNWSLTGSAPSRWT